MKNINVSNKFISIIIPTYNYSFCILDTIHSVLQQSYKEFELIVVDDGSKDDTRAIVSNIKDSRIRYIYQKNQGANVARNRGFHESSGGYLIFLDSDDVLEKNYLEELLKVAMRNSDANIYGPSKKGYFTDLGFNVLSELGPCPNPDLLESWIKHDWWIFTSCVFWKRENLVKVGGWDEALHANQDGDIAMRALIEGIAFIYAENAPPVLITSHKNKKPSISDTKSQKTLNSRYAVFLKLEIILKQKGMLNAKYQNALGVGYYVLAQSALADSPEFSEICYRRFREMCGLKKPPGSYLNWIGILMLGIRNKTRLSNYIGRIF
ncbi:Glycosyltransferase, GT2 family [Desulfonatronum thiosulfatophilum]|uniref:Glycosyltransferase, GT2 family n=1 Tax=Desulfonatronum thiosulfatophilum TaxID=617002 RepID=A0A1G6ELD0_9BACT|nr:glycosyltransferase family A protein [Desulfonatronum thiosulfatophilum]SDB58239.1 Glycosyltransferase, GT2 family [Desulfonatronum thiosulfatophilum]